MDSDWKFTIYRTKILNKNMYYIHKISYIKEIAGRPERFPERLAGACPPNVHAQDREKWKKREDLAHQWNILRAT